jgi:maltooligosyltrehalose trehalohydrolase
VIYEFHVGTFTPEGTFRAAVSRLDDLRDLGVNAMEIMPAAQFPGTRNWGYDGVYPFAVQDSYGGPRGLKEFVAACHERDMAVVLDVVYNHFGPEGNYTREFAPYFTGWYRTPWGEAVNFDGAEADGVREFFVGNVLHWFGNYHLDGLRLDAVHSIYDLSSTHILKQLAQAARAFSQERRRTHYLIAESDLNDARIIRPWDIGGYGLDAVWNDDFHHCLHALVTGERQGYYSAFGRVDDLAECLARAFVYRGQYNPYRRRRYGAPADDRAGSQFVVFAQNHDQVGNRMCGERLSALVPFGLRKVVAGVVLLSPYVPMLFMGEEYGEDNPFLYFVSHGDPSLVDAVRAGRAAEFAAFAWQGEIPDPQAEATFRRSVLDWDKRRTGEHKILLDLHRTLISLRSSHPALTRLNRDGIKTHAIEEAKTLLMFLPESPVSPQRALFCAFNFSDREQAVPPRAFLPSGRYAKVLDSAEERWSGPGSALPAGLDPAGEMTIRGHSFAVYEYEGR